VPEEPASTTNQRTLTDTGEEPMPIATPEVYAEMLQKAKSES
jgi:hypothetical protein